MAQPILQPGKTGCKRYGRPKVSARVPRAPNDEVEKFPTTPSDAQSSDWSVLADRRHGLRRNMRAVEAYRLQGLRSSIILLKMVYFDEYYHFRICRILRGWKAVC